MDKMESNAAQWDCTIRSLESMLELPSYDFVSLLRYARDLQRQAARIAHLEDERDGLRKEIETRKEKRVRATAAWSQDRDELARVKEEIAKLRRQVSELTEDRDTQRNTAAMHRDDSNRLAAQLAEVTEEREQLLHHTRSADGTAWDCKWHERYQEVDADNAAQAAALAAARKWAAAWKELAKRYRGIDRQMEIMVAEVDAQLAASQAEVGRKDEALEAAQSLISFQQSQGWNGLGRPESERRLVEFWRLYHCALATPEEPGEDLTPCLDFIPLERTRRPQGTTRKSRRVDHSKPGKH